MLLSNSQISMRPLFSNMWSKPLDYIFLMFDEMPIVDSRGLVKTLFK